MAELPKRKPTRLSGWDYSSPGAYFVTICTHEKRCTLSRIVVGEQLAAPEVSLSAIGKIVDDQIRSLPARFPFLAVDSYVIMPNHIHLLLILTGGAGGASSSPTIIAVVQALKSQTARLCSAAYGVKPLWQRSFHDHVIRGEDDCRTIRDYIANNPAKWAEDRYFAE